jgi:competence protein ComEA
VSDLDRPRLALYVALGLAVCVLGARYLSAHERAGGVGAGAPVEAAAPDGTTTAAQAGAPTVSGGEGAEGVAGSASVRVDRADGGRVTVHVAGAVRQPGLYRLPPGARIDDALRRAGGPGQRADLTAVNLATKLEDGRQVLVPERPTATSRAAPSMESPAPAGVGPNAPVNLNTATIEQLDTLDGVGPGIAQRIIDYREQHGGFRRVEELAEVPGIGAKRLAALTPQVAL